MKKTMNCFVFAAAVTLAFAAGVGVAHFLPPVWWAAERKMTAQVIHSQDLNGDALGVASNTGFRSQQFVATDGMTLSVQDGNVPKHMHPLTNEIQYILEGTGTIWLDDKEEQVKPGDMIIIPKGTAHGGTKPNGHTLKAIAIKTPPQPQGDTKPLP